MSTTQPAPPPAIAATKIITLLEQQKIQQGDANGTFSINLKHDIKLVEGDSISLSKGFIDTSSLDSNFIRVEDTETEITIKTGIYYNDIVPNPDNGVKPTFGLWSAPAADRPRGDTFILQNQSESSLNTFFDWRQANNTFIGANFTDFNLELQVISEGEPNFGIFDYKLIGAPELDTPILPTAPGQVLVQRYINSGHLNLSTDEGTIDFLFYPLGYVPPVTGIGKQDHTAVFTRWIEALVPKGWKAKSNLSTTLPAYNGPGYQRWSFLSDTEGYNYFSDRDVVHNVRLEAVKLAFNDEWESGNVGTDSEFLAVALKYKDTQGVNQSVSKVFSAYPPLPDPQGVLNRGAGVTELRGQIDAYRNKPTDPRHAQKIDKRDIPDGFTERKYGWGDRWLWYNWSNWEDPLAPNATRMFPAIEFVVDDPPHAGFVNYNGKNPVDQGFINQKSQYIYRSADGVNQGNTLQPWQMTLKPVGNASSTGSELTPREYTTTITLAQGDYTYDDLAQTLTDELNKLTSPVSSLNNNPADPTQPPNMSGYSSSYLLQTSYELMMQYDGYNVIDASGAALPSDGYPNYPNSWVFATDVTLARTDPPLAEIPARLSTDPGVQPYWLSEDTNRLFSFNKDTVLTAPRVCGAENFSIVYDDTSQTFQILQAHTPIYIDGPILSAGPPVVKGPGSTIVKQIPGQSDGSSFAGTLKTIETSSGVFITDIQPRSLWFGKMGFTAEMLTHVGAQNSVIQNFTVEAGSDFSDNSLSNTKCHPMKLTTGLTKTGYFVGVDSLVSKNATYGVIGTDWSEDIEVNTPTGILGRPIIQAGDDQPFYNIEISGINNQDFAGQIFNNNLIQGIVGKYFSSGNFTQSTGDGILYTHKGAPLTISSLRVRILDTQMQPEINLGPNSAFILEINTDK